VARKCSETLARWKEPEKHGTFDMQANRRVAALPRWRAHASIRRPVWCAHGLGRQGNLVLFWYGSERRVLARIRIAIARGLAAEGVDADV
jgi:hypothetical protein